ncbi:MAG: cytochrome C [Geobacteraceae bacterium GWC2_58_44]|nr:MAG: cytochrome C [Geobacteraceae bacterium GWC2_58_44]
MRLMMLCIAACFLTVSAACGSTGENCTDCHRITLKGIHAALPCLSCHGSEIDTIANPAAGTNRTAGCVGCHRGYARLFDHAMGSRSREKLFVDRSIGALDPGFFENNCNSCHLRGCTDCHGGKGHDIAKADDRSCFNCHKGYFVGTDYYGMAPREDSLRYQRGEVAYGETFLKMTPDVHAEAGMKCGACHAMTSLVAGAKSSKTCLDCHTVDKKIIEHRISAHLEKMECYACHSAWAAQEYGTFYLRFAGDSPSRDYYRVRSNEGDYVKSAYLRKQDAPPLGLNARGKVSPIRPQFILYFTDIRNDRPAGTWPLATGSELENRLLAAEWKAFFPHTIRRGTVMCEGCHDDPRRFIMERGEDRIYQLQADGMTLPSFWNQAGQRVINGDFLPVSRYLQLTRKSPAYQRAYLEKWQSLINHVENSSQP